MSARPIPPPKNPSRVAKPVGAAVLVAVAVAAVLRATADGAVDEQELAGMTEKVWDALQALVPPLLVAAAGWLASRRAERNVTPILTAQGDLPRDLEGRELRPVGHGPEEGYPRERERERPGPRRPRVDRRGVDRG